MTNKTYAELFQSSGGGAAVGGWTQPIFGSKTITFTQAGSLVIAMVGAGGGGAANANTSGAATGGNSGPWGRKKITVSATDVLVVNIGAGGAKAASANTSGSAGSASTVTLNGTTILTVQGGEGGGFALTTATASAPVPTATVTGADFWVPGLQAGTAQVSSGQASSGGAAPDLLQTGLGRSPAVTSSGGVGLGGSVGTNAGGVPLPWVALAEWGFVITDSSTASTSLGAPGRGATPSVCMAGPFGGGGGGLTTGGIGAGGCAAGTSVAAGNGGDGYAFLTFTPLS